MSIKKSLSMLSPSKDFYIEEDDQDFIVQYKDGPTANDDWVDVAARYSSEKGTWSYYVTDMYNCCTDWAEINLDRLNRLVKFCNRLMYEETEVEYRWSNEKLSEGKIVTEQRKGKDRIMTRTYTVFYRINNNQEGVPYKSSHRAGSKANEKDAIAAIRFYKGPYVADHASIIDICLEHD